MYNIKKFPYITDQTILFVPQYILAVRMIMTMATDFTQLNMKTVRKAGLL